MILHAVEFVHQEHHVAARQALRQPQYVAGSQQAWRQRRLASLGGRPLTRCQQRCRQVLHQATHETVERRARLAGVARHHCVGAAQCFRDHVRQRCLAAPAFRIQHHMGAIILQGLEDTAQLGLTADHAPPAGFWLRGGERDAWSHSAHGRVADYSVIAHASPWRRDRHGDRRLGCTARLPRTEQPRQQPAHGSRVLSAHGTQRQIILRPGAGARQGSFSPESPGRATASSS